MRPIIENDVIVGISCDDVIFTVEDCYRCEVLHKVLHKFMEEHNERDNTKEDSLR